MLLQSEICTGLTAIQRIESLEVIMKGEVKTGSFHDRLVALIDSSIWK